MANDYVDGEDASNNEDDFDDDGDNDDGKDIGISKDDYDDGVVDNVAGQ